MRERNSRLKWVVGCVVCHSCGSNLHCCNHALLNTVSVVASAESLCASTEAAKQLRKACKALKKKNSLSFSVIRMGSHICTFVLCTALSATAFCFLFMFLSVVRTNSFLHYFESGPDSGWVECGMVWGYGVYVCVVVFGT